MSQNDVKKSTLRSLTTEEVNAVSGGVALIPLLIEVAKVTIILVLEGFANSSKNKDKDNSHESNSSNP